MKAAYKTTPEEKTSLTVSKWIKAAPARVFKAWTSPQQMSKWFAPDLQKITPHVQADFKVGGHYRIEMKQAYSKPIVNGKYLEIVANKKIVFSWVWEGTGNCSEGASEAKSSDPVAVDSVVTVEFKDKNGGTEVVLTHERLPNTDQAERHTQGWTGCLENLAHFTSAK